MARDYLSPGMPHVELTLGDESVSVVPDFLEAFTHEVYQNGDAGQATITLYDPTYEYLENLIITHNERVRFRYGWRDDSLCPWRHGVIFKYTPRFSEQGLHIDLHVTDTPVLEGLVKYNHMWDLGVETVPSQVAKSAGLSNTSLTSISDIVRVIATRDLGLTVTRDSVVDTRPTTARIHQNDLGSVEFILKLLCSQAQSRDGHSGYKFWIDNQNVAHFAPTRPTILRRSYVYGRGQESEIVSFSPGYDGLTALAHGAGDLVVTGYDPLTGKKHTKRFDINASTARTRPGPPGGAPTFTSFGKFGETSPNPSRPYSGGRVYHSPFGTEAGVEAFAAYKWTMARNLTVEADIVVLGDHRLTPGDAVGVQVIKRTDGQPHYTSGQYLVNAVSHVIKDGTFLTTMKTRSQSLSVGGETVAGIQPQLGPTQEYDIPGRDKNSTLEDAR